MEFDLEQEARVWSRVLGDGGAARVAEMARREAGNAAEDARLARRLGSHRLGEIARRERIAAGELAAAYYLMTGEKIADPASPPRRKTPAEILRGRFRQWGELAAGYAELAERMEAFSALFSDLAEDAKNRGRELPRILAGLL